MKYFFVFLISIPLNIYPQVTVNVDSLFFLQTVSGSRDSLSFFIRNISSQPIDLSVRNLKSEYTLSDSSLVILEGDSVRIWIRYQPRQNVIDRDLLFISGIDSTTGVIVGIYGSGKFGDGYDAATFNLYDTQLKSALTTLVSGHTSLGYNLARDKMYMEIDNKKVNGQGAPVNTLECVYTGRQAIGYVDRTNAQNSYNFNTEHTWPQSTFSENEPMKSDLYHLFPTDVNANSIRANYPFGKVVSAITWDSAGSRLGRNSLNQLVFEPRNVHKGDVSRSMFYFLIRYPQNYGSFFSQTQELVFREWNSFDTVSTIESARNSAIASFQLKRNPFIDHPEFVDRVYSFATNNVRPVNPILDVLPLKINYDSTQTGDSTLHYVYIANKGNGQLVIDSVSISDSRFKINPCSFVVNAYSNFKLPVHFKPDSSLNYNALLTVYSGSDLAEIVLTGIGIDNTLDLDEEFLSPNGFSLEQNYPNPFNPSTKIKYTIAKEDAAIGSSILVRLKVFDILGNEVVTLVNELQPAGTYEVEFSSSAGFVSGVYFYRLQAGDPSNSLYGTQGSRQVFVETKKMILIR